jgi:hypothetical protein
MACVRLAISRKSLYEYARGSREYELLALLNSCCHADSMRRRRQPAHYPMEELSAGEVHGLPNLGRNLDIPDRLFSVIHVPELTITIDDIAAV